MKFCDFYIRLHGVPDMIVSDQDPKFMGKFWAGEWLPSRSNWACHPPITPRLTGKLRK
jgi:hypothetical protein